MNANKIEPNEEGFKCIDCGEDLINCICNDKND